MKRYVSLFTALAVQVLLLAGCGSDKDATIAVLDGEKIPVSLIHDFFERGGWTFESYEQELEMKRAAVDSVIDYKLLVKGAYEAGLNQDREIEKLVASERVNFLFDALYRKDLAPAAAVTDQEVREFYDKIGEERHVAHILVTTSQEADSVMGELNKGVEFDNLARMASADQSTAVRGGDLGWLNWTTGVVPEFRDALFAMKVGETSQPIKTEYGYHIIRLLEIRPVDRRPYEELEGFLRQALASRRVNEAQSEFIRKMEEIASVQVNPEATGMLMERLDMYYPDSLNQVARPDNFFPNLDLLKPFEKQMVIASYTGGEVTVEDYMTKIAEVPEAARPRFDDEKAMKRTVFQLELKNIVEFEAEQRKIQDSDEYLKRVSDFREGLMADRFVRQVLGQQISINEDEITEYYNSHLDEFTIPQEYHVLEIQMATPEALTEVVQQLRVGADFGELAAQHTIRPGMQRTKGDLGFIQKANLPKLWEAASTVQIDKTSDIILNDEGTYSVIKVIDIKQPVVRTVEQVSSQVSAMVTELKRSSAKVDWLKQRREKASIEIHAEVLEKTIDKSKYENKS